MTSRRDDLADRDDTSFAVSDEAWSGTRSLRDYLAEPLEEDRPVAGTTRAQVLS